MTLFLSSLCGAFAAALLAAPVLPAVFSALGLPHFSATASAMVGVIIAGLEYRQRKGKKKKRAPMLLVIANALLGVIAAAVWLYTLLD